MRKSAAEIDVDVGRMHDRRRAGGWRGVLGKRQLDVAFGKADVLPTVRMIRHVGKPLGCAMPGGVGKVGRARHPRLQLRIEEEEHAIYGNVGDSTDE